ncbi:MAG TPA: rhomboid family intramembrane serine protease [Bacteriovoracaceae bacterium]|nr:rhomboid family intramembrane serine protease [Bacteriovoracaceae bacterium]
MAYKLEKTFLSNKLRPGAMFVALLSFLTLLLIFSLFPQGFEASGESVFHKKEYWRIFSSALLHADLNHLSHNAFFFTGLALLLNGYFGLMVFPVLSFLAGGIINLITLYFYPPEVQLVGISGVVYFMAAFWLTSFILIERRQPIIKRYIYATGMALIFLFPETFQPHTSYLAHATGFFLGIPAAGLYFLMNKQKIRNAEVWVEKPEVVIDFDWEGEREGESVP